MDQFHSRQMERHSGFRDGAIARQKNVPSMECSTIAGTDSQCQSRASSSIQSNSYVENALASPVKTNLYSPGRTIQDEIDEISDDEDMMLPPSVATVRKLAEEKLKPEQSLPEITNKKQKDEKIDVFVQKRLGITSFYEEVENCSKPRRTSYPSMENVGASQVILWKSKPESIKKQIENSRMLKALLSPPKTKLSSAKDKNDAQKKYAAKYGLMEEEEFSDDEDEMLPPVIAVKKEKEEEVFVKPVKMTDSVSMIAIQQKLGVTSFCEEDNRPKTLRRTNSFPSVLDPVETGSNIVWKSDPSCFNSDSSNCSRSIISRDDDNLSLSVCLSIEERKMVVDGNYTQEQIHLTENIDENQRTTIMIRNIPNKYTKSTLLALIHMELPEVETDFFYLPIDFRSKSNMGYCFVNFEQPEQARAFTTHFKDFNRWQFNSNKKAEVIWSQPFQGLAGHIDRYRNSPVMHESVEEEYKPSIFLNGEEVPFPQSIQNIEPPKLRRCKKKKRNTNRVPMGFRVPN